MSLKVTELTAAVDSTTGSELMHVVQSGNSRKMTLAQVTEYAKEGILFLNLGDTPADFIGAGGHYLAVTVGEDGVEFIIPPTIITSLLGLSDTPANYTGAANKFLAVNAGGTAVEFVTPPFSFTGLTDTPVNYTGAANKLLAVNAAGNAVEFVTAPTTIIGLTDTPANYTGAANKLLAVNATGNAVEFITPPSASSFTGLSDTPANYTGHSKKKVTVKSDETGLEFVTDTDYNIPVISTKTASYSLVSGDTGGQSVILMDVASANNLTVSASLPVKGPITIVQKGAGQTTIVADTGVTIVSADSKLKLRTRYSSATLICLATNSYLLIGDITT